MSTAKQLNAALRAWAEVFMARSMHEWMRFVKGSGLSMPQFSALMRLYYRGECGISDISAHLDVTAAAASQLVEGLVQKGLLERVENPRDRRAKQVSITPKGRALIQKGIEVRNQWIEKLAVHLTAEQRATVVAALKYLTQAAEQLEPSPAAH